MLFYRRYTKFFIMVFCLLAFVYKANAHPLTSVEVNVVLQKDNTYQIDAIFNLEKLFIEDWPSSSLPETLPDWLQRIQKPYHSFAYQYVQNTSIFFDRNPVAVNVSHAEVKEIIEENGEEEPITSLIIHYTGTIPEDAKNFSWQNTVDLGTYLLTIKREEASFSVQNWLDADEQSQILPISQESMSAKSTFSIFQDYLVLGFTHILPYGLDHILFVLGIFFFSLTFKPMLLQVSAFTIAHTVTLALTIYGVISLPSSWVEPIIAISIAYVGIENIVRSKEKFKEESWSRVLLVFGFGLLHGMGFAGVLEELGIPDGDFFTALISFNLGVEFGQLSIILGSFLLVGWFRNKTWYRNWIQIPVSALIALFGIYWTIERVGII